ncbi:UvrD-helicase domain-containing protein [Flavobacterium aquidurense]|uniref:UvrD-helicase domain-containing protein n=1 Tax=Flavobacterium aquidurense TaxID=362413 RepID=UPI003756F9B9
MEAFDKIKECIETNTSYVVEAGAGSGKTYVLIQTLNYLIETKQKILQTKRQSIICITYTNVAKNEIIKRIEYNDLVNVFTIHEFLWQSIKQFQKQLKIELCKLNEIRLAIDLANHKDSRYVKNLVDRIDNVKSVFYNDSSFRDFEKGELHHDDIIELSLVMFKSYPLLTSILSQKYPYIFIDEYQDTSIETIQSLLDFLLGRNDKSIVLGFYGDSHQKIYDTGVGSLENYYFGEEKILTLIKKEENYRSSKTVVNLLNNFRTNIKQDPKKSIDGSVQFIYWAEHPEKPKTGIREFNESLKTDKNKFYDGVLAKLVKNDWNFENESKDKILVLANSRIAERAGFPKLYKIFSDRYNQSTKERLLDRNHFLIKLFTGHVDKKTSQERKIGLEHLMAYWLEDNQNQAIRFLKKNGTILYEFQHPNKKEISVLLDDLSNNRNNKTVKEVLRIILEKGLIFSKNHEEFIVRINQNLEGIDPEIKRKIEQDKFFYESFISLSYNEISNFWRHIQNETVFSTKHGTKGDEYRNVLTVIDDTEWVQKYNFNNFFNNSEVDNERKLRTRNLFYVECSRAKENLVVLMLSKIEENSLLNIKKWFGTEKVFDIKEFLKS